MTYIQDLWPVLKKAVSSWLEDRAPSMGAALAYYSAFSIAPLLIIVIAVAGIFFGRDATQEAVVGQLQGLLGEGGGAAVSDILKSSSDLGTGLTLAVGVATLLLGSTTAFVELQDDLDRIWKAEPRVGSGIVNFIRSRFLSFGMILLIGFLLTVSLALSAAVSALGNAMFGDAEALLQVVTFVMSFAIITVLFAMIFKVLPNVEIDWRDVWIGAAITALLFEIGKLLIGLYLGKSSVASSFGAAGPFVVLIVWLYYSTQIFLLGAEFTHAHAEQHRAQWVGNRHGSSAGSSPAPSQQSSALPPAATPYPGVEKRWAAGQSDNRSSPDWLKRLLGASAAGLVAGFTATRLLAGRTRRSR